MQLLAFKLDVAESLISGCESDDSDSEPEPESEPEDEAGQARKRKSTPLPLVHKRVKGTHLPEMDLATYSFRCRNPGCSQRAKFVAHSAMCCCVSRQHETALKTSITLSDKCSSKACTTHS